MTFPSVTPRDFALVALTQTYVRQKAKQSLETLNANELLRRCLSRLEKPHRATEGRAWAAHYRIKRDEHYSS